MNLGGEEVGGVGESGLYPAVDSEIVIEPYEASPALAVMERKW